MHAESLTLADAVRYHMSTPRNPLEIAAVLTLEGRMDEAQLAQFAQRLASHARFRQTVAHASFPLRPRWEPEPGFDVAAHVVTHRGPHSESALAQAVSESLSNALSFERSPWRLELFPLRTDQSALLFRVHHCVSDGLALVRLVGELADEPRPEVTSPPPANGAPARRGHKHAIRGAKALSATLLRLTTAAPDRARELHELSGEKRVAWSGPVDLQRLAQAADLEGCHVTELLLSATAEALSDTLRASGQPVPATMNALVPFGSTLGKRELGNHYASTFVELVLDEPNPRKRLERMAAGTAKLHDATQVGATRNLIGLAGWLSPPLMRRALTFLSRRASLVVSNVPGPAERMHIMGHEVRSAVAFAPGSLSIGLSFTLFGYAGELRLGVEVDAAIPLDPAQLAQSFERALSALSAPSGRA